MKVSISFLSAILLFFSASLSSQSVEVIKGFDQLEEKYFIENDTTYVINFWATWCKPCVQELPYFEALNVANKDKKVRVIFVSLDFKTQLNKKVIPFVKKHQLTSKVLLLEDKDYNSWLNKVDPDWSGSIPATLLIHGEKRKFAEQEFENQDEVNHFVRSFTNNL